MPVTAGVVLSKAPHSRVTSAGKEAKFQVGEVVSSMVTTWLAVTEFPAASVNVQTMVVTPVVLKGKTVVVVPVMVPEQLSVVVGGVRVTEHCSFTLANTGFTGGVTS
jgi:hypothetical protein